MSDKNNVVLGSFFMMLLILFIISNFFNTYAVQFVSFSLIFLIAVSLVVFSYLQKNKQLMMYFILLMFIDVGFIISLNH